MIAVERKGTLRPSSDLSGSDQRIAIPLGARRNGIGIPGFGAYFPLRAFLTPKCELAEISRSLSVDAKEGEASAGARKNLAHRSAVCLTRFAGIAESNLFLRPGTVNS